MMRIGYWVVILLLFSGSASAQLFYPEKAVLDNGLTVVVLPNHRAPVVTHMLWFKAGAIDETWGKSGIAHFLEHLMFKGTPRYPEGEYSRIISSMGGQENAFTSHDYTAYYATIDKKNLTKVMDLESDRFMNWRVTDEQVARERDVVLKERQQITENNPVAAFFEEVNAVLYPNHPYQKPVIGWREEIEKLNRTDAEAFVKKYYVPENAILVLSGDVTLQEILPQVQKYYGAIPKKTVPKRDLGGFVAFDADRVIQKKSALVNETVWSRHLVINPAYSKIVQNNDAIMVLQKILGDGRTGRLYRRLVVEDKIATSASISFNSVAVGPSRLTVIVVPKPDADLKQIEQIVSDEISKIVSKGVTESEVQDATQAMEVESIYARDSVSGPANIVGAALASGWSLDDIEAWSKRMRAIQVSHVNDAAQKIFGGATGWVTAILMPEQAKGAAQ